MPKMLTGVASARAKDLTTSDVVRINGKWRRVLGICTSAEEAETVYLTVWGNWAYPEMAAAVHSAFGTKAEGDYVIVRYAVQEKSDQGTAEDDLAVLDAFDLLDVQIAGLR